MACLPSGQVIGKGGVDYEHIPSAGALLQFAVREPLRSCGIGSALIRACERRIQRRGLGRAEIDVEENNPETTCVLLARI